MGKCFVCCVSSVTVFWLLSLSVWLGIYVGVWVPYFDIDWRDSQCLIQQITNYRWEYIGSSGEEYAHYAAINVLVNVSSHWIQGFACGMPDSYSYLLGSNTTNDKPPYVYARCTEPDVCGRMELAPAWWCSDCEECSEKLTGEVVSCHWTLSPGAWNTEPEEWPLGYRLDKPLVDSAYLQVVLRDEVYYNKGEFIVLHIFGAIGILVPPVILACAIFTKKCCK